jgi:hypothetical protein
VVCHRLRTSCAQVDRRHMPFGMARLDLGHVQHLVDQARQALGLGHDDAQELLALRGGHAGSSCISSASARME